MATTPKIRYDIEAAVSGGSDVNALATQLEGLANTLEGDLKVQALASAQALRTLGEKQGAIDNFVGLKTEAQAAADRLNAAQLAAQSFAREIAANGAPTRAQSGQLEKLRDAVREASSEMLQSRRSVEGARDALTQYGVATTSLSAQQRNIKAAVEEQRVSFDLLGEAARTSAEERVQAEARAATAAQASAQKEEAIAAQRQRLIESVSAANNRAVGQAKAAEQARLSAATATQAAERNRAEMIERYNLRESLSQQALLGRLEQVRAQYPRLGAAAQAAGFQQTKSAEAVRSSLSGIGEQLRTVQNAAIAVLGGSFVGSLAKDVADTADEFNNLAARIKLVTGEGAAFESAFQGVQEIALRTNSELEATATLFVRIAQAGKELGLSQEAALSLTETINQSIQLSGGSADSAKAAIIQLVQGLQSGVVRGEEFNSIMEQSPRLARALADGLGVTTGELRKLSQQGQLTTEVVLNALQGQSAAVAREFEQLPPTVGRAIQNLSTAWTVYIGEADKASGASTAAAAAINTLGQNLDTIIGLLLDAGQAGAAFVALRLAQQFLGMGSAAQAAAVQIGASTAAMNAAGAASVGAGAGVGRFAALLGGLKLFSLLGLVTNFQDIGTWIGESAAKLAGFKDLSEDLARTEKLNAEIARENAQQRAAMAQATQLAIEASRGLTPEAKLLTSEFEKLRTSGKGVEDALHGISKNANLGDTAGIQAFSIAMRDLGVQGKASGDQIREAFSNALKGEDLASFEVRARAALSGSRDEAELLTTVLDASLREAIRRSGADFAVISGGMGEAARSAINDTELIITNLDRLGAQGVDTAAALTASIGKGIQTADSTAAVEALRQQVELVRKVLGDQVANTFLDQIGAKAKQVTLEVGGLSDALKRLGITSDADLKLAANASRLLYEQVRATGGSAREQGEAFRKMAADAIASGDASALSFIRAQAAIQGFEVSTDSAGKTTVRAMNEAADATRGAGRAADGAAGSYGNMAQSAEQAAAAAQRLAEINAKYASPLGADKYSAPKGGSVTGNTREERLAGQNAVDNTLLFELREKLAAGTLTAADADDLRNTIAALQQNQAIDRDADRFNPGAFSLSGLRDRNEYAAVIVQFQQALQKAQVGRNVVVELRNGRTTETVNTDEAGAAAIVRSFQNASLAAGG